MLLGVYLYKQGVFSQGLNKTIFNQALLASLILIAIHMLYLHIYPTGRFSYLLSTISAIPMALLYIHFIVKLCRNRANKLKPLQAVGKMALTCYLLQSIVGVLLFRYIYPHWVYEFNRIDYLLYFIIGSVLQCLFAMSYLYFFKQGPMEKLWRILAK